MQAWWPNFSLAKLSAIAGSVGLAFLLTSCVIYSDHSFSGEWRINQQNHWIEITPGELARTEQNKWYLADGPGKYHGVSRVSCLRFSVGLPSYKQPPPFKILRVEAVCNKKWRVKMYRLPSDEEHVERWQTAEHEIWVNEQEPHKGGFYSLPEGAYVIKVHYLFGEKEYDAEWDCAYRSKTRFELWRMPQC